MLMSLPLFITKNYPFFLFSMKVSTSLYSTVWHEVQTLNFEKYYKTSSSFNKVVLLLNIRNRVISLCTKQKDFIWNKFRTKIIEKNFVLLTFHRSLYVYLYWRMCRNLLLICKLFFSASQIHCAFLQDHMTPSFFRKMKCSIFEKMFVSYDRDNI